MRMTMRVSMPMTVVVIMVMNVAVTLGFGFALFHVCTMAMRPLAKLGDVRMPISGPVKSTQDDVDNETNTHANHDLDAND